MGVTRGFVCCIAGLALTACQYATHINQDAYRLYHESRWNEAVLACIESRKYKEPESPATPRIALDNGIEGLYASIPELYASERRKFAALADRSELSTEFVADMLSVLNNRDTTNIEHLAEQIEEYFKGQEAARAGWQSAHAALDGAMESLRSGWAGVWADNDLKFDFEGTMRELRLAHVPELSEVRVKALQRYYDNEYSRQAMIYLDYDPGEFNVIPKSHVPEGCDELSSALNRQEAGLLVRYSLDQAISNDVALVQKLALVDLSKTPWEDVKVPKGRYAEPRVAAAIARLKLLKYIDELLSSSLDVFLYDVDEKWGEIWPGNTLETNIFGFAGLPRTDGLKPSAAAKSAPGAK